jgi:AraC-like DNA-binding protein
LALVPLEIVGARGSELLELRRLGAGLIAVESATTLRASASYVFQGNFSDVRANRVVTFRAQCPDAVPCTVTHIFPLQFRIGNGRDRFALLSFFAQIVVANGDVPIGRNPVEMLLAIDSALSSMLTEGELCARLDVNVSTFRRWFNDARAAPGTVLRLARVARLAEALRRGASLDTAALAVGYSTASNARRAMRLAVNVLPHHVQRGGGYDLTRETIASVLGVQYDAQRVRMLL